MLIYGAGRQACSSSNRCRERGLPPRRIHRLKPDLDAPYVAGLMVYTAGASRRLDPEPPVDKFCCDAQGATARAPGRAAAARTHEGTGANAAGMEDVAAGRVTVSYFRPSRRTTCLDVIPSRPTKPLARNIAGNR